MANISLGLADINPIYVNVLSYQLNVVLWVIDVNINSGKKKKENYQSSALMRLLIWIGAFFKITPLNNLLENLLV